MADGESRFTRLDPLLFAMAVVGLVLFFVVLPSQHPDSGASYSLGPEAALRTAEAYLAEQGYDPGSLEPRVSFHRQKDLLVRMQRGQGRVETVEWLNGSNGDVLPAYYWRVTWSRNGIVEEPGLRRFLSVYLTESGKVWRFRSIFDEAPEVNRDALAYMVRPNSASTEIGASIDPELTDSLLAATLFFQFPDSSVELNTEQDPASPSDGRYDWLLGGAPARATNRVVQLGPEAAVAFARYHLTHTALADYPLVVESVRPERTSRRGPAARVLLVSQEPIFGQDVRCEVEVEAAGTLRMIDVAFNGESLEDVEDLPQREDEPGEARAGISISTGESGDLTMTVGYILLILLFVFLFFRRLNARMIDSSTGLRDGLFGGFFLGAMVLLVSIYQSLGVTSTAWTSILLSAIGALIAAAGGAVLLFLISSTADSITREYWPEKLETITLARFASFINRPVGLALLRGVALSGVLLGVVTLLLLATPKSAIDFSSSGQFLHEFTLSPVSFLVGLKMWYGLFVTILVLLGVGSLIYRRFKSAWAVLSGMVFIFALLQLSTISIGPVGYEWLFSAVIGAVLAYAFWRYDVLVCLTGYVVMQVLIDSAPGWLVGASPERLDAIIAFILPIFLAVIGFVGISSQRQVGVKTYVPSYLKEIEQEERLRRELELAHQVQATLLPRKMPEVEGLDVAGMCLAAQEVGGDYYDFVKLSPTRLAIVVGDVSGKGIQAAFYMTLAKGFVQTLSRIIDSPAEVLRRLNALFYENAPRGMFISMIYGVIDLETRTFTFARAGHNPVILKRSPSREAEFVLPAGLAIGLVNGSRFDETLEETTITLRPDDVLVFYTDGFSEAMNEAREQYGDERLASQVGTFGRYAATEILRAVSEDVRRFVDTADRHDDMTMVVAKFGAPQRPTTVKHSMASDAPAAT